MNNLVYALMGNAELLCQLSLRNAGRVLCPDQDIAFLSGERFSCCRRCRILLAEPHTRDACHPLALERFAPKSPSSPCSSLEDDLWQKTAHFAIPGR